MLNGLEKERDIDIEGYEPTERDIDIEGYEPTKKQSSTEFVSFLFSITLYKIFDLLFRSRCYIFRKRKIKKENFFPLVHLTTLNGKKLELYII